MVALDSGSTGRPGNARPYLVAGMAILAAFALRAALHPWLGTTHPYTTLLVGIAVASAYVPPQVTSTLAVLGYVVARHVFVGAWEGLDVRDIADAAMYAVSCLFVALLGSALQRAKRRAAELEAKEDEQRHFVASILDSIGDCFYAVDREWRITYVNRGAQSYFGKRSEELLGKSRWEAVASNSDSVLHKSLKRAMDQHMPVHVEGRSAITGHWIDLHAYPWRDGLSVFFTDAEERKNAEQGLRRAAARLQTLLNNTPLAVIEWDKDFRISRWSGEAQSMFGWTAGEVIGRQQTDFSWIFEADRQRVADISRQLQDASQKYVISYNRNYTKDGRILHCEWYNSVLEGEDGKMDAVLSLVLDVTERHRLQQELQNTVVQLRGADRRKDEFLATLAHELRNPLAPLGNSLEAIRLAPDDPVLRQRALSVMTRQLDGMVRLIDDLLDLSRITTGKLRLRRSLVDIKEIIAQAMVAAEPLLKAGAREVAVTVPEDPLHVYGDEVRLAQVLTNLLRNAAKFTDAGGKIAVSAAAEGENVRIAVRDDGVGIPEDKLDTIFEMFSQAHDGAAANADDGLGIGLHIAKRIVEMHGGAIAARSAGAGKGSEFAIELALASGLRTDVVAEEQAACASRPLRVLVADDNRDAADSVVTLLGLQGHEVHAAYDGLSAWHLAERIRPDVALLDLGMPGLTGLEVARRIRQAPWGRSIRIAAISGWAAERNREETARAGFDAHLAKPVSLRELSRLLSREIVMRPVAVPSSPVSGAVDRKDVPPH